MMLARLLLSEKFKHIAILYFMQIIIWLTNRVAVVFTDAITLLTMAAMVVMVKEVIRQDMMAAVVVVVVLVTGCPGTLCKR